MQELLPGMDPSTTDSKTRANGKTEHKKRKADETQSENVKKQKLTASKSSQKKQDSPIRNLSFTIMILPDEQLSKFEALRPDLSQFMDTYFDRYVFLMKKDNNYCYIGLAHCKTKLRLSAIRKNFRSQIGRKINCEPCPEWFYNQFLEQDHCFLGHIWSDKKNQDEMMSPQMADGVLWFKQLLSEIDRNRYYPHIQWMRIIAPLKNFIFVIRDDRLHRKARVILYQTLQQLQDVYNRDHSSCYVIDFHTTPISQEIQAQIMAMHSGLANGRYVRGPADIWCFSETCVLSRLYSRANRFLTLYSNDAGFLTLSEYK